MIMHLVSNPGYGTRLWITSGGKRGRELKVESRTSKTKVKITSDERR